MDVATAAFRMCLTLTLSDLNADCKVIAAVIEKMINLANTHGKDGPEASPKYLSSKLLVVKKPVPRRSSVAGFYCQKYSCTVSEIADI